MNHPYSEFESTRLWKELRLELQELEENQDIQVTTAQEYIVGCLCKRLKDAGLLIEKIALKHVK